MALSSEQPPNAYDTTDKDRGGAKRAHVKRLTPALTRITTAGYVRYNLIKPPAMEVPKSKRMRPRGPSLGGPARPRSYSLAGRMRSASELADNGAISAEAKNVIVDALLADDAEVKAAMAAFEQTGQVDHLQRECRHAPFELKMQALSAPGLLFLNWLFGKTVIVMRWHRRIALGLRFCAARPSTAPHSPPGPWPHPFRSSQSSSLLDTFQHAATPLRAWARTWVAAGAAARRLGAALKSAVSTPGAPAPAQGQGAAKGSPG